jgi:hypothetical protein
MGYLTLTHTHTHTNPTPVLMGMGPVVYRCGSMWVPWVLKPMCGLAI